MDVIKWSFASCYTFCMIPFKNISEKRFQIIIKPVTLILTILLLPLIFLVVTPFVYWRTLLFLYLRVKHGDNFVKILNMRGVLFFYTDQHTMKAAFNIKCDNVNHCITETRNATKTILEEVVEYACEYKKCLGYYYLCKKPINIEEAFSVVSLSTKRTLSNEEFNSYFAKCEINNNQLFQVRWIKEPLDEDTYVLMVLLHHGISDGHGILSILHKYLFDQNFAPTERNKPISRPLTLNDQFIDAQYFKGNIFDSVLLPCTNPFSASFSEKSDNCVPKLKALRRKFRCGFNELIMSLFTYSLFDYMKQHLGECPQTFSIAYIRLFDRKHTRASVDGVFYQNRPTNNAISIQLQFSNLNNYSNFHEFHQHIATKYKESLRSIVTEMTFCLINYVLDYLPAFMYRDYCKNIQRQAGFIFSNVGVLHRNTIFGYPIVSCSMGMNHMLDAGMFTAICSYDGKLQITLGSKLHFLKSGSELQVILDSAIAHIHQLYDDMLHDSIEERA